MCAQSPFFSITLQGAELVETNIYGRLQEISHQGWVTRTVSVNAVIFIFIFYYLVYLAHSLSTLLKALFLGRYLLGFGIGLTHPAAKRLILNIVLVHLKQGKPCKL